MNRDQVTSLTVGIFLLGLLFLFPYSRYGVVEPSPLRPELSLLGHHEGFRPIWQAADPMGNGHPSPALGIRWPVVLALAGCDVAVFGGLALLLRGRDRSRPDSIGWVVGLFGLACYIAACAVPAVDFGDGHLGGDTPRLGAPSGWVALLLGWFPPFTLAWLANPAWLFGMFALARARYTAAWWCGVAAATLGLMTLLHVPPFAGLASFLRDGMSLKVWGDHPRATARIGFYLWETGLVAPAVGAWIGLAGARRRDGDGPKAPGKAERGPLDA